MNSGQREVFEVNDREGWLALRARDVTASQCGALLGVHEYQTAFGLYCAHTGATREDPELSPAMERGQLMEPVALQILARERPTWQLSRARHYWRDADIRLGATPDASAIDPAREGFGNVQIKTVADIVWRQKWWDKESGTPVPPLWIACQSLIEAHLSGASWCCVAALVMGHGLEIHVVDIPMDERIVQLVRAATVEHWQRVADGRPWPVDYGNDGALIGKLYAHGNGLETVLDGDNEVGELLHQYDTYKAERDMAETGLEAAKTGLKTKLGHFETAWFNGRKISWKETTRRAYSVAETSFRQLRVGAAK